MGLFDLAGRAIGGAVGFTASVAKDAYDATVENKIQQETQDSFRSAESYISQIRMKTIERGNNLKRQTIENLYQTGLKKAMNTITRIIGLSSIRSITRNLFFDYIKGENGFNDLQKYVDEVYCKYLDRQDLSYIQKSQKFRNLNAIYKAEEKQWVKDIHNIITEYLKGNDPVGHIDEDIIGIELYLIDIAYLFLLLGKITSDENYNELFTAVCKYCYKNTYMLNSLQEKEYGVFDINIGDKLLDDGSTYASMAKNAIEEARIHLSDNESGFFEGIKKYLRQAALDNSSVNLWHYAMLTPFDQRAFDLAVQNRNFFTSSLSDDFEVILAEIYVKNKLGGSELVLQNIDTIMNSAATKNPNFARGICSFLAWMECYDLEYEVLKQTVAKKIQLSEEMQKRLAFLAEGGKAVSIKIYNPGNDSSFCFDTHSLEWRKEEFEMLIHKLQASKSNLKYALVLKGWHKPFSIQYGKKFTIEALEREFDNLVSDFEGEVVLEKKSAYALNVNNMSYDSAYIFRFTSERNRGVNVLFECEKFGRNLQLNILVTFMPDNDMDYDDMLRYILSAKDSIYVKSFLESILQAIDASLNNRPASIYD
ncbi:MAG: hypothetical protein PUA84_07540 [Oscillospiraceae bacterium]|nr:hypothetical protein [Oscillospiraceae bacterium]